MNGVIDTVKVEHFYYLLTKKYLLYSFPQLAQNYNKIYLYIQYLIDHINNNLYTQVVFIGMFISTYCWGYLSDNFGRRKVGAIYTPDLIFKNMSLQVQKVTKQDTFVLHSRPQSVVFTNIHLNSDVKK